MRLVLNMKPIVAIVDDKGEAGRAYDAKAREVKLTKVEHSEYRIG